MVVVSIDKNNRVNSKQQTPEIFEFLVFHRDGTLSLQTTRSIYFYAHSFYYAARDLSALLKGEQVSLQYGIVENRISDPDAVSDRKVCVPPEKILQALDADEVTSNWPGIVKFFSVLRGLNKV